MSIETILIISVYAIVAVLLLIFVPRDKIRQAIIIFLFKQFITWIVGLAVVQLRLIEYPVRSFPYATRSSFDFEYFVYPAICILFNLYYPEKKNSFARFMHYFYYCTVITLIEQTVEKYTDVIKYIHWSWYLTWITLFITFYISRKFYIWYFRLEENN